MSPVQASLSTVPNPLTELDARESEGTCVSLLWDRETGETWIELETETDWVRFPVPADSAHDAFIHPWVFMGSVKVNSK